MRVLSGRFKACYGEPSGLTSPSGSLATKEMKMSRKIASRFAVLPALVVLVPLLGCSTQDQQQDPASVSVAAATEEAEIAAEEAAILDIEATEELLAVLSAADQFDGESDHIVSKCPGCGLAMEGNAEHALHVADYELHFCSDTCKGMFSEHAEEALLALNVPAGE